tara:strand:+ start:15086 stop:15388 length:303 start_codon:yes stop_codon:yes gene_type:complete
MVEVGKFYKVNNSRYVEYGIKKWDIVYLAGEMMLPLKEEDPYLHRKLFVAAYVVDGHVQGDKKPITVDGLTLTPVSKVKQEELKAMMEEDFSQGEELLDA